MKRECLDSCWDSVYVEDEDSCVKYDSSGGCEEHPWIWKPYKECCHDTSYPVQYNCWQYVTDCQGKSDCVNKAGNPDRWDIWLDTTSTCIGCFGGTDYMQLDTTRSHCL